MRDVQRRHVGAQLAREAGARVIAAAGGPRKVAVAADLGADATADYTRPGWSADLGEAVDVVFDGVGGDLARDAFDLIRDGGRMYCYGAASGAFAPVRAQDAARRGIALEDAARAHAAIEARATIGKTLLLVGSS